MKTTINPFLIALGLAAITTQSFAEVGIVETTAAVNNGTGTVFVSATGGVSNPRWSGYNFGTFDLGLNPGPTLRLTNFYFENYAYSGGSIPVGGSTNNNWLDNASTATFKLFRDSTLLSTTSMRQSNVLNNNRNWDLGASGVSINILDGLTGPGTYNVSWTIEWTHNQFADSATTQLTQTTTSGGNATFSTIPEPSSSLLTGLGLAGLAVLRRVRKNA